MNDLQTIPGVGTAISRDLQRLGIKRVSDLRGKNPEKLYQRLCAKDGPTDRCMLYVMRCAVYYASHKKHQKRLLLWWNWKDKK